MKSVTPVSLFALFLATPVAAFHIPERSSYEIHQIRLRYVF